jgi:hypothetical protein
LFSPKNSASRGSTPDFADANFLRAETVARPFPHGFFRSVKSNRYNTTFDGLWTVAVSPDNPYMQESGFDFYGTGAPWAK